MKARLEISARGNTLRRILLIIISLLLYGSLYPWDFVLDPHVNPLRALVGGWSASFGTDFPGRDFSVNVAIYFPLGTAAYLTFKSVVCSTLIAVVLSTSIELAQAYHPLRYSSALDVLANVTGAFLGGVLGKLACRRFHLLAGNWLAHLPKEPVPTVLLLFWATSLLFPFFPVLSPTVISQKISSVIQESVHAESMIASALVVFILGRIICQAFESIPLVWLGSAVIVVPAQLLIAGRETSLSKTLGAVLGWVLFAAFRDRSWVAAVSSSAFLGLVAYRATEPHQFQTTPNIVSLIPFATLLDVENAERGLTVLLEKAFYYGTAIWVLVSTGLTRVSSTVVVSAALLCFEVVQIWLPGRSPETTDPITAALIGIALFAIRPQQKSAAKHNGD